MNLALVGPWCAARRNHPNLVGLNRPEGIWTNLVDPKEKKLALLRRALDRLFLLNRRRRRFSSVLSSAGAYTRRNCVGLVFVISRSLGDRAFGGSVDFGFN